jgi:hypothetical protein
MFDRPLKVLKYMSLHLTCPLTVSPAFPRVITESERGEVQKLPFIGTKVSNLVGCARSDLHAPAYYG